MDKRSLEKYRNLLEEKRRDLLGRGVVEEPAVELQRADQATRGVRRQVGLSGLEIEQPRALRLEKAHLRGRRCRCRGKHQDDEPESLAATRWGDRNGIRQA